MGVLKSKTEKLEKFILPSTKDLPEAEQDWVVVDTSELRAGDVAAIDQQEDSTSGKASLELVASRIKDWSYTTEDMNSKAIISKENVAQLNMEDFAFIAQKVTQGISNNQEQGLTIEEKKS